MGIMKAVIQVASGDGEVVDDRRVLVRVVKRPRGRVCASVRSRGKSVRLRGRERVVG